MSQQGSSVNNNYYFYYGEITIADIKAPTSGVIEVSSTASPLDVYKAIISEHYKSFLEKGQFTEEQLQSMQLVLQTFQKMS